MKKPMVLLGATVLALLLVGWVFLTTGSEAGSDLPVAPVTGPVGERVTVGAPTSAPAIAKGFIGFSIEYQSIAADAGTPANPNTVMDRLIGTLNPNQRPVIRVGGDSTDHTWWPVSGAKEPGFAFTLTPAWLRSVASFARATDAKLMLGIDLEMNQPRLAAVEARALLKGIGAAHIAQWEIGNEPSLYAHFPWYRASDSAGASGYYARDRSSYSFSQYLQEFEATAAGLPDLPLAGPALGAPTWMRSVGELLKAEPGLSDVTYHAYPLNCFAARSTPEYSSIPNLLSRTAYVSLADGVAPFAAQARQAGRAFRVDELNSSACGGRSGVSDTFASALWVTNALFAMASKGVTGVNIQDFNAGRYKPFGFALEHGHWAATVYPMYYGLLLFSRAAPPGSRLLSVRTGGADTVQAWAAQTPGQAGRPGPETVTLVNSSRTHAETVAISAANTTGATVARMLAPSAAAKHGVTLDGRSYGAGTSTGALGGSATTAAALRTHSGVYEVTLGPASAALLTLTRR